MPKEKHYWSGQVEDDGQGPDLTVEWSADGIWLNGNEVDLSAVSRLIRDLTRARDKVQTISLGQTLSVFGEHLLQHIESTDMEKPTTREEYDAAARQFVDTWEGRPLAGQYLR